MFHTFFPFEIISYISVSGSIGLHHLKSSSILNTNSLALFGYLMLVKKLNCQVIKTCNFKSVQNMLNPCFVQILRGMRYYPCPWGKYRVFLKRGRRVINFRTINSSPSHTFNSREICKFTQEQNNLNFKLKDSEAERNLKRSPESILYFWTLI